DNIKQRIRSGFVLENFKGNRKSWYFSNVIFAIEYFKTFDVFCMLSSNTRRILAAKMALLCSNLSNAYYSMKVGSKFTVNPDGTSPFEGPPFSFAREFQAITMLITTLRIMDLDENEYVLVKALMVLSPSLEDASENERALISKQSESYAKALFSYVIARRGRE
ncbi:hypothetical protein PENTCL1PPCAC_17060, partial [Pristionchus entomophagus]